METWGGKQKAYLGVSEVNSSPEKNPNINKWILRTGLLPNRSEDWLLSSQKEVAWKCLWTEMLAMRNEGVA